QEGDEEDGQGANVATGRHWYGSSSSIVRVAFGGAASADAPRWAGECAARGRRAGAPASARVSVTSRSTARVKGASSERGSKPSAFTRREWGTSSRATSAS